MNKRQAVAALQKRRSSSEQHRVDLIWIKQTLSYYETIFGKESHEYSMLDSFIASHGNFKSTYSWQGKEKQGDDNIEKLNRLLDSDIETLKFKGLRFDGKPNFLYRLSNTATLTWVIPSFIALISGAFLVGSRFGAPEELQQLRVENRVMADSVARMRLAVISSAQNKPKADTAGRGE